MPLSADVRTQVCVPVHLAPFVSSSSPEAAHLSVALFHFSPLQSPPVRTPASLFYYRHTGVVYSPKKKKNTTYPPSQCYLNASTQPSSLHLSGIGPEVTSCWSLMRQLCSGLFYSHLFWLCACLIIIIFFLFCNTREEFLQNGMKKGTWQWGIRKKLSPKWDIKGFHSVTGTRSDKTFKVVKPAWMCHWQCCTLSSFSAA